MVSRLFFCVIFLLSTIDGESQVSGTAAATATIQQYVSAVKIQDLQYGLAIVGDNEKEKITKSNARKSDEINTSMSPAYFRMNAEGWVHNIIIDEHNVKLAPGLELSNLKFLDHPTDTSVIGIGAEVSMSDRITAGNYGTSATITIIISYN